MIIYIFILINNNIKFNIKQNQNYISLLEKSS